MSTLDYQQLSESEELLTMICNWENEGGALLAER